MAPTILRNGSLDDIQIYEKTLLIVGHINITQKSSNWSQKLENI